MTSQADVGDDDAIGWWKVIRSRQSLRVAGPSFPLWGMGPYFYCKMPEILSLKHQPPRSFELRHPWNC